MSIYAGLDVSDKATHVCVVDGEGRVLRRDAVASDPEVLAKWLGRHCPGLARVVLETGPLSTFLYHGLAERGVAVECICARHAKGVLSARVNKSDVHDAEGLAQIARTGWFKRVYMKASATHIDRAALRIRVQLIAARTAMANQLRGLLKLFGLRMGTARTPGRRTERLAALYAQRPDLAPRSADCIHGDDRGAVACLGSVARGTRCRRSGLHPADECPRSWPDHRADLHRDHRRSPPLRQGRGHRCLCWACTATQPVGRTRHQRSHLQGRRSHVALSRCTRPPMFC
jgi:hypothetical protein